MVSKPQSRATLIDTIDSKLQSSATAPWTDAEKNLLLDNALTEISRYSPYVMRVPFKIESRTGAASSTSANNLVDSDNSQFASTDTGKVVFNTSDKTWAVIESYTSASQVGLSKDIFTSGEGYEIYNKGCWSSKQINISDVTDWLWIMHVVYPTDRAFHERPSTKRNFWLHDQNKILEIDVGFVDDSAETGADVDVDVVFACQHKLNPNTDLAGAVNNAGGYSAGATSMALNGLTDADATIFKDTLFTVALASGISSRYTYKVTADASISSNAATISFFPGLEAAVDNTAVVTFFKSTLTPELERLIVDLVVGEAMISESISTITSINTGGVQVPDRYFSMGSRIADKARKELLAMVDVDERANFIYSRG